MAKGTTKDAGERIEDEVAATADDDAVRDAKTDNEEGEPTNRTERPRNNLAPLIGVIVGLMMESPNHPHLFRNGVSA